MTYKEKVTTKVSKWGNSLGIRLPARSAARAGISDNTILSVESNAESVTLRPVRVYKKSRTLEELLKHVRPVNDAESREWLNMKPVGKEIW